MDEIDMIRTMETPYEPCNNRRHACAMVARAYCASSSSQALLIGWPMTTNPYSGMPATRHMSSAALTNRSVITAMAGTPSRSAAIESCKLHDEQLPQSPTPATTASHCGISSMMRASAGAL
jgi:hypothetical protein